MSKEDYIANSIHRILAAPCADSFLRQREIDLADAVRIAANEGEAAARHYLHGLSRAVENGKYRER